MGRIALVVSALLRVVRGTAQTSDLPVEQGGGNAVTATHASAPGDDASPLVGDYTIVVETAQQGGVAAIAYVDPRNAGVTQPGEKRIYARRPDGTIAVELYLKNDGSQVLTNGQGKMSLGADGIFNINGVTIDKDGNIDTPGSMAAPSVLVAGKEQAGHTHSVTSAPGQTGVNE